MEAQGNGSIINVSCRTKDGASHLDATKRALEVLSAGLAQELAPKGIAVNCLRPVGWIDTPGALINEEVTPADLTPPYSYLEAMVLLSLQTADAYSGRSVTDAELLRDLTDEKTLRGFKILNPPAWRQSIS
jgi:NAD(P)-dependent dehydrogenase (short-subunit alcohol dehydrogenase family)